MSKRKHTEAPEPPAKETPELSISEIMELADAHPIAGDPPAIAPPPLIVPPPLATQEEPASETRKPRTRLTPAEKMAKLQSEIATQKQRLADNVTEKRKAVDAAQAALDQAKTEYERLTA
jgi:hypothetical protein